jgi:peptide/nickel transport system ATP-binding protein
MSVAKGEAVIRETAVDTARTALEVDHLRIDRLLSGSQQTTIVSSISLSLGAGETIGIVGESGSGKSMTARAILGLLPPRLVASGRVMYGGRNLLDQREREWRQMRGREIGLIMQDPFTMLNPVLRCGTILRESLRAEDRQRLGRRGWRVETVRRLAEVGITNEQVIERYPFELSGGMRQRVAIAAALAGEPKVLIADEPSTALDVTTQRDILALIKRLQTARGMSLVLITHDLRLAFAMCDRIYVLYAGALVEAGPASEVEAAPLHPYSHGLLLSEPPADRRVAELHAIPGAVPTPDEVAGCCTFAPRCRWVARVCRTGAPALREVAPNRRSACVRIEEIRPELVALHRSADSFGQEVRRRRTVEALIEVRSGFKIFGSDKRKVTALEDVSLTVGENESVGLVGESGSGKTTLARILMGLERPTSGEFLIDGIDASDRSKLSRRDLRKLCSTVQVVFQDPYSSLNPMRTVGSTLSEAIRTNNPRAKRVVRQVNDLLLSVGLGLQHAQRKPVALSGGERQRVAIARALAVEPRILICDEPVSALDVSVQAQILNLFTTIRKDREMSYLFITHDLSIVRQVAEHLYVMHGGRIVESGLVEEVLDDPQDPYTKSLLASIPRSDSDWLSPPPDDRCA